MTEIDNLLYRLGATANYTGFRYISCALHLCIQQPERLLLVTKRLYPDIGKRYGTNWKAVERISGRWETSSGGRTALCWNRWLASPCSRSPIPHSCWLSSRLPCAHHTAPLRCLQIRLSRNTFSLNSPLDVTISSVLK